MALSYLISLTLPFFNDDAQAYESSGSDSSQHADLNQPTVDSGASEEEIVGPAIEVINTQFLHQWLDGQMVDKVHEVLCVMA